MFRTPGLLVATRDPETPCLTRFRWHRSCALWWGSSGDLFQISKVVARPSLLATTAVRPPMPEPEHDARKNDKADDGKGRTRCRR